MPSTQMYNDMKHTARQIHPEIDSRKKPLMERQMKTFCNLEEKDFVGMIWAISVQICVFELERVIWVFNVDDCVILSERVKVAQK